MLVIVVLSTSIAIIGAYFIKKNIIDKAQIKVEHDLNMARELYMQETRNIKNVIRFTASRFFLRDAIFENDIETLTIQLEGIRKAEKLDILTLTNKDGQVIIRCRNKSTCGDDQKSDEVVSRVLSEKKAIVATTIVSRAELVKEGPDLAEQANIKFMVTPKAKPTNETEQTSGMMIKAASPIFDSEGNIIAVLYGGNLINRNYDTVDKVKKIIYQDAKYKGKDIGTVTIFQDDLRISTNVKSIDGKRAIGTRVSEEVNNRVLDQGLPWVNSAFVVTDWYKTAYEPIKNIDNKTIGMLYVGILERPFNDIAANTLLIFLATIFAATILAVILSVILASRISRPLTHLIDATAKLSDGELGHTIETKTGVNELDKLAISFNQMSEQLRERDENLKLSNDMLADLNRRYIDLIGFVAHELRGILASAVMNSYAIKDGLLGLVNFKQRKAIDSVTRNLDYLTSVVGKFLNLGRIEKGELNVNKIQINISKDVFDISIESLLLLSERKKIKINNHLPFDLMVNADLDLMQIVANNLIGNAIKYGDENGNIEIKSHEFDGQIEIDVYNDSVPISTEQKEKLFARFYRLNNEGTKKVKGTGLGLYITKQIIEKHGGNIRVEPRESGNSFIFKIEKG